RSYLSHHLVISFFFLLLARPPSSTLFPYTTLFRSIHLLTSLRSMSLALCWAPPVSRARRSPGEQTSPFVALIARQVSDERGKLEDRKSTRLNSSHVEISYAVFCLKKKK